jgi:hypothetical protein
VRQLAEDDEHYHQVAENVDIPLISRGCLSLFCQYLSENTRFFLIFMSTCAICCLSTNHRGGKVMAEKAAAAELMSTEDRAIFRSIGRALWRLELPAGKTVEERKASWADGRRKYMQQARKLRRFLETEGATVTLK